MLVYKFGGTSVGSVVNMNHVKEIINTPGKKIVVLSAMSGTTNNLVEISELLKAKQLSSATAQIQQLHLNYNTIVKDLIQVKALRLEVNTYINSVFSELVESVIRFCLKVNCYLHLCLVHYCSKKA